MSAPDSKKYKNIQVSGAVSVQRMTEMIPDGVASAIFLILGPTGAGKSAFIEALASKGSLQISSNQLEGFTQSISTYKLINVERRRYQIYLVDVPGFADTKVSERRIVSMLKDWMLENETRSVGRILYLTPIHTVRLPGSQRQVLKTFEALTGLRTGKNITVVSTMWDSLWGESATRRAESNFNQLRDNIWADFIDEGSQIVKFLNTQESALSVLDTAFSAFNDKYFFDLERFVHQSQALQDASFGTDLYNNLLMRVQNIQVHRHYLQLEIESASVRADEQLLLTLVSQLYEINNCLARFEQELGEFKFEPSTISDTAPARMVPPTPTQITKDPATVFVPVNESTPETSPSTSPSKRSRIAKAMRSVKFWDKTGDKKR